MSFKEYRPNILDGDTVVLFMGHANMLSLKLQKGEVFQTKFGALHHDDVIGKKYGSKVRTGKGFVYVLHFTPELWTLNLPHRTQILYATDISMVTIQLDLKPGSIVVESGTGSGSLSHSIIRAIAPTGHLHTFEFHEERSKKARKEFDDHDIGEYVTVRHRDVCENGFDLEHVADAVFLDLPRPWDALVSAKTALRKEGGRLCSFSPCIEQVQKSCEKLRDLGFTEIVTLECLLRPFNVSNVSLPMPQMSSMKKRKYETDAEDCDGATKVLKQPDGNLKEDDDPQKDEVKNKGSETKNVVKDEESEIFNLRPYVDSHDAVTICGSNAKFKTGIPPTLMPGHTGYLTFATLLPYG
ncbi:unnamed protein product [Owenia fusiformis]|uniref:tRNA (adenine(58)-N(1))-methyltransferase catalytic subunit TRMT61A n=1 Tax=Owenia fusiformis TaxID=6347 RepID=A0A8J1UNJ8_OWEFU|nr:unnamed protein product [Owenia fusiformis]